MGSHSVTVIVYEGLHAYSGGIRYYLVTLKDGATQSVYNTPGTSYLDRKTLLYSYTDSLYVGVF